MSEGTKTGVFWCVAVVMLAIAAFVAWPPSADPDGDRPIGKELFEKFTDPLVASSMKVVTYDEEKGTLDPFEVRKDRETGQWTIPSRGGYPADAVEHMKNAANAFVGLKILDIQTANAEDHDDLGVAEPKLEDLEIGDEGVGRLVTFKDESQNTLASLIIGNQVRDNEEQVYVRIPGQDPVYVVKLDESPLTTNFTDWIESDLLQLSSIDIEDVEIKDYTAAGSLTGQISLKRDYDAKITTEGTNWTLDSLAEYTEDNPLAPPTPVTPAADEKLNTTKLNDMKNALDDLEIADVARKPDGMSATLRANQDLLTDKDAVGSLFRRGFYPIQQGSSYEILSANGELTVGLNDGVQYVMRFGNISGVSGEDSSEDSESGDDSAGLGGSVNRYMLVMTQVDESKFPAPDLKKKPETLEDLKALIEAEEAANAPAVPVQPPAAQQADAPPSSDSQPAETKTDEKPAPTESVEPASETVEPAAESVEPAAESVEPAGDPASEPAEPAASEDVDEGSAQTDDAGDAATSGQTQSSGQGEATGTGQGQVESPQSEDGPQQADQTQPAVKQEQPVVAQTASDQDAAADASDDPPADGDAEPAEAAGPEQSKAENADDQASAPVSEPPQSAWDRMTDEEKQERLEAEQEKITKENQRKLDERKDKLDAAKRRVADLNARFADWYYVIAEDTYSKLRIGRDQLFESPSADPNGTPPLNLNPAGALGPSFQPQIPQIQP